MRDLSRDLGPGTIAYAAGCALYLNVTNRCPNDCVFCVRRPDYRLWGHDLRLRREPTADEVVAAVGDPGRYTEIVFCGLGEPTHRPDLLVTVARRLKAAGARRLRLNTNGLADRLGDGDVLPPLAGLVDATSVSLNAQDAATYQTLCRPRVPEAYAAVLDFLRRAKETIPEVTATVVAWPGVDVAACARIAHDLGAGFRVRGGRR